MMNDNSRVVRALHPTSGPAKPRRSCENRRSGIDPRRNRWLAGISLATAILTAQTTSAGAPAADALPAPLPTEEPAIETLGDPSPHWILVNDFNALGPMDTKVYLFDADSGRNLGMLSTGGWRNSVETSPDFSTIYSPETYYARGTRGERTDVLSIYDTRTLSSIGEVVIPPRRATGMPHRAWSGRSGDGRFVYVGNMTPATSVSVIDVERRALSSEIETSGCAMVYPVGNRSFASLCGNGTVQVVDLDEQGALAGRRSTARFFDPERDPVTEKAARAGNTWYFISFNGMVHPVTIDSNTAEAAAPWSLFSAAEREAGWKVGGLGFASIHEASGRLYVITHQGGADTHKHPGKIVRVYDLDRHTQVSTIELGHPAAIIAVSRDSQPLLYATSLELPAIMVYDATSGAPVNTIAGPPLNPTFIEVP